MARAQASICVVAIATSLLVGCGGGSSPTAPDPGPSSLAGTWRGEMSGSVDGAAFTCSLRLDLDDEGAGLFVGVWRAECPGGTAAGALAAFSFAGVSILTALASPTGTAAHPLATCGWGATPVTLQGNELRGDWVSPDGCEDTSLAGGPLRVRFAG
jgi:hypothetical protein